MLLYVIDLIISKGENKINHKSWSYLPYLKCTTLCSSAVVLMPTIERLRNSSRLWHQAVCHLSGDRREYLDLRRFNIAMVLWLVRCFLPWMSKNVLKCLNFAIFWHFSTLKLLKTGCYHVFTEARSTNCRVDYLASVTSLACVYHFYCSPELVTWTMWSKTLFRNLPNISFALMWINNFKEIYKRQPNMWPLLTKHSMLSIVILFYVLYLTPTVKHFSFEIPKITLPAVMQGKLFNWIIALGTIRCCKW